MRQTVTRRRYLLAGVAGGIAGLAGCGNDNGSDEGGDEEDDACSGVVVESPDGTTNCVVAVESDRSVSDYYGYNRGGDSASTPDELSANDAVVTFVYRNTSDDQQSLVTILGDDATTSDGGGNAVMTFEGVEGYEWQVQDGPQGPGPGDTDTYETPNGTFGASESVIWGWNDSKTDGGAFGPLDEGFDVTITSPPEGTVGDRTQARQGLDRWLLVDGDDLENYIELASVGEEADSLSVGVRAADG